MPQENKSPTSAMIFRPPSSHNQVRSLNEFDIIVRGHSLFATGPCNDSMSLIAVGVHPHSQLARNILFRYVDFEPMYPNTPQPKRRNNVVSSLNVAIETLNLAKEVSGITPAKAVFGFVSVLLTMVRVSFILRCLR